MGIYPIWKYWLTASGDNLLINNGWLFKAFNSEQKTIVLSIHPQYKGFSPKESLPKYRVLLNISTNL